MRRLIYPSARKHGVDDDDLQQAIEFHSVVLGYAGEDRVLYLGPDTAANMLEVIALRRDDGSELVIHAMRMQRKYEPLLRRLGGYGERYE